MVKLKCITPHTAIIRRNNLWSSIIGWPHRSRRLRCKINLEIYVIQLLHPNTRTRQRASALPWAKIEVIPISAADHTASPASPISSLVYRSRYPRAISSLVIPTWVIERRNVLPVVVVILWKCRCHIRSPYKFKDEKAWKEKSWLETIRLTVFMYGLIVGVEDLVHFR